MHLHSNMRTSNYLFRFSKVGCFARGLFLIHSECLESNYISSRPFRVNAVCFDYMINIFQEWSNIWVLINTINIFQKWEFSLFYDFYFKFGCIVLVCFSSEVSWMCQGPVHAYVAVPGEKTSYLSELKAGREVVVVDQNGIQRTAIVGRVKIETRPLILIEANVLSFSCDPLFHLIF